MCYVVKLFIQEEEVSPIDEVTNEVVVMTTLVEYSAVTQSSICDVTFVVIM